MDAIQNLQASEPAQQMQIEVGVMVKDKHKVTDSKCHQQGKNLAL